MVSNKKGVDMNEKEIKQKIDEKWNELVKLFYQYYIPGKYRLEVIDSGSLQPRIRVIPRGTKTKPNRFVVTWREKNLVLDSEERKGASVLGMVVKLAGVDRVQKLNISARGGNNLVCDSILGIEKHLPKEVDGKFVITKSENTDKFNQIKEIIQRLNINAEINWV